MATKDYYQILGVKPDAKPDDIKRAFHKLALHYHPDKNPGNRAAEQRFKEITEANEVLSDPEKRSKYDQLRDLQGSGGFPFGGAGLDLGELLKKSRFSGFGGLSGLGDLFESIFKRGGGKQAASGGPQRGEDLSYTVTVPFETAVTGGRIPLDIPSEAPCTHCGGQGAAPGSKVSSCESCGGTGQTTLSQGGFALNRPCPSCFGRGSVFSTPCPTCRGDGTVQKTQRLMVKIPAGITDGQQIRLAGQGRPGNGRAPAGDLMLKVLIAEHPDFRRNGNDIFGKLTINVFQALCGAEVVVGTIDGEQVKLVVPAGTHHGAKLRLKGKGILGGDHFAHVEVTIPRLSEGEKEKLRALAREARIPL